MSETRGYWETGSTWLNALHNRLVRTGRGDWKNPYTREQLLAIATTMTDDDILAGRNVGQKGLCWIRGHAPLRADPSPFFVEAMRSEQV